MQFMNIWTRDPNTPCANTTTGAGSDVRGTTSRKSSQRSSPSAVRIGCECAVRTTEVGRTELTGHDRGDRI